MTPPVIETGRLILRGPRVEDFEPFAAFFASPRSIHEDGPLSRREAWREFASSTAGWTLRGYGTWSIEERTSGTWLGEVGIYHPDYYPEAEIGWTLAEAAEGRGIAEEAARAARDWAWEARGLTRLVSYIAPANTRSIRLAGRLGARRDPEAAHPADDPCLVYRHPDPEAKR